MSTLPKDRSPLLPDRHPTPDFFVCDIFDAAASPRGDMASMEHPVFSLSTKPDYRVRKYENNGNFIEVKPSADGLATVHDRCVDLLHLATYGGSECGPTHFSSGAIQSPRSIESNEPNDERSRLPRSQGRV